MVKQYKEEFSNYLNVMNEALQNDDFAAYRMAKGMLEESVDEYKSTITAMNEVNTNNFGLLNHIFEAELPRLIKENKKGVSAVIKTIRQDKNLCSEFNFYNSLKDYKGSIVESVGAEDAVTSLMHATNNLIDKKSILESNEKLRQVMVDNDIYSKEPISKELQKLYESGHVLLTATESIQNAMRIAEAKQGVVKYIEAHKNDEVKENIHPINMIREFEDKLKEKLNESELSFVQQITDFRSPIAEERKAKLFNKLKNECLQKIDEMLQENANNTELRHLKEQISKQTFTKETIIQDVAKLLEIRDVLLEK